MRADHAEVFPQDLTLGAEQDRALYVQRFLLDQKFKDFCICGESWLWYRPHSRRLEMICHVTDSLIGQIIRL